MKCLLYFCIVFFLQSELLYSQSESELIIQHVNLIDGTGAPLQCNMDIFIKGNRITKVVKSGTVLLRGTKQLIIINGRGKYLIPGLWDMHVHLAKIGENSLPLFIANGITSVRDMGGDASLILKWRDEIATGIRFGPRIKTPGPILESFDKLIQLRDENTVEPYQKFRVGIKEPKEVKSVIDSLVRMKVDFIKIRTVQSLETYKAIADATKQNKLMLAGHSTVSIEELISAGQQSIEHVLQPALTNYTESERRKLFHEMAEKMMFIVPTMVTGQESLFIEKKMAVALVNDSAGKLDIRRKYVSGYLITDWMEQVQERTDNLPQVLKKMLPDFLRDLKEMKKAGVRIMAGSDAAVALIYPGFTLHTELELLVNSAGLTPMETIIAATSNPSCFFGMQDSLGTIRTGMIADLILLNGNPLAKISNTQKIEAVIKNGKYFTRKKLNVMLDKVAKVARY